MARISIIGGYGAVGRNTALLLGQKGVADHIVLMGPNTQKGEAVALDLTDAFAIGGHDASVEFSTKPEAIAESDVVIITAGKYRTPEMRRDELVPANAEIVRQAAKAVRDYAPNAFVIVVTNPLDGMVGQAYREKGGDPRKIAGMAGVLDSARFRNFIAEICNVPVRDVDAMVIGEHGEAMVPLPSRATVAGKPLMQFCSPEDYTRIVQKTRDAGKTILELSGVPANIAPAVAVVDMVEDFLNDRRRLISCCSWLEGAYGLRDIFIGVPSRIGAEGAVSVELPITVKERKALHASAAQIRALTHQLPKTNTCHL